MTSYLRTLWQFNPSAIRLALGLNLATALTEGASLLLLLPLLTLAGVIDQGDSTNGYTHYFNHVLGRNWSIGPVLSLFVATISLQSLLVLNRDRVSLKLTLCFSDYLRRTLYSAIANARWNFLTNLRSGELTSILTVEIQRISAGTFYLLRFIVIAFLTCSYVIAALLLSVWVTLLALASGALLWILLRSTEEAAKKNGSLLSAANLNLANLTQEFLSTLKLIKTHGEQSENLRHFNHEIGEVTEKLIEFQRTRTQAQGVYRAGGAIALAFVCYGALMWFKLPVADLLVMTAIFARMLPQLAELQNGRQQLLQMLPAFLSWQSLLKSCLDNRESLSTTNIRVPLKHHILLEHVKFSYPQSALTLEVKNLKIPANKTTAIFGASGSGKSTLLDLISTLIIPDSGIIRADESDLTQISEWRNGIAYISQEVCIFDGSIIDNLMWGNANPSDAEVYRTLELSALTKMVNALPLKLETQVGERGIKLSGGEKQRLALARALLRKPQLLILDEAFNALDAENHRLIVDAIHKLHGSMTIVIASHRHEELNGLIDGFVHVVRGEVSSWRPVSEQNRVD